MKKSFAFAILIAALLLSACGGAATPTQAPPAAPPTAAPAQPTAAPAQPTVAPQPTAAPAQPTETPAPPTATPEPTKIPLAAGAVGIDFWSWVPGIQDQVNEWNAAHPDIQVNYINKGNGNTEYAALNTALQANSDVPDVVQIEYQHLPS